jgi:hypothetical protein
MYGMVSAKHSEGADYISRAANVSLLLKDDAQRQEQRLQQAVANVVRSLYPTLDFSRTSEVNRLKITLLMERSAIKITNSVQSKMEYFEHT